MNALSFLNALSYNNNREWFMANKAQYEAAYSEIETLTAQIITGIAKIDDTIAEIKPKECLFRIYRDARYSKDMPPYKTNFGAFINRGGKRSAFAGYYLHIEPDNCFVCAGAYRPDAVHLQAIRAFIDANFVRLQAILNKTDFHKYFNGLSHEEDTLSKVPRGFDKDSPAAEFLKMKHFIAMHYLGNEVAESVNFGQYVIEGFTAAAPLVKFLNEGILQDC